MWVLKDQCKYDKKTGVISIFATARDNSKCLIECTDTLIVLMLWWCTRIRVLNVYSKDMMGYQAQVLLPTNFMWMLQDICDLASSQMCSWWRHQMETFSALLAICAGNSRVTGEFPTQRPVAPSFDVFFDLHLNKRLCKPIVRLVIWDAIVVIMTSLWCFRGILISRIHSIFPSYSVTWSKSFQIIKLTFPHLLFKLTLLAVFILCDIHT